MASYTVMNRARPRKPHPNPETLADIDHVRRYGYVVLENVFTKEEAEAAKAEMRRLSSSDTKVGRNRFEGFNTNRIYALLNKSRVFDKFAILPRVLALNDHFLDEGYLISIIHTIQINPGETPQELHFDDGFCQLARPRNPMGTAIMLAFDDFTAENGATTLIPGSHTWDSTRRGKLAEAVPMVCKAGSAVFFIGTTWHGGGSNITDKPRMSATVQYCQPYLRQIENQVLAVDPRRLPQIPKRIVEMMGYRTNPPFMGHSDGLNPIRGANVMVERLQKPLDLSPPTFPAHDAGRDGSKL